MHKRARIAKSIHLSNKSNKCYTKKRTKLVVMNQKTSEVEVAVCAPGPGAVRHSYKISVLSQDVQEDQFAGPPLWRAQVPV